jgi:dihydroorotase
MPNTTPALDSPELVRDVIARSAKCKVKVLPCAAITKGLRGEELTDFSALKAAGAVAVSDDGMPVVNEQLMGEAMVAAKAAGLAIISHCEPENEMTAREVSLAKKLNVPIHIAHVSTATALAAVQNAPNTTYEIAPHHFTLTSADITDADYKMNPPLRESSDVSALLEQLSIVNCKLSIASDHAPHTPEEKGKTRANPAEGFTPFAGSLAEVDFDSAPNGVLGLETILAVTLTRLYHEHSVPLERIVDLLCVNPRRILGILGSGGGVLEVGAPADIAIVDLNEQWTVDPDKLQSKSRNTCFKGMKLRGRVKYTLVNGEVVYDGRGEV